MLRKLLYSFLVLAISIMLAASAFAQPQNNDHQNAETGDVSRTISMDSTTDPTEDPATDPTEDPATDSATDPTEDPATPPPSDSVFASMSDDACPGVLDPVVVESFRITAPTLVQRCEALRDAPLTSPITTSDQSTLPTSDQSALPPSDLGRVLPEEGNTIDSNQP